VPIFDNNFEWNGGDLLPLAVRIKSNVNNSSANLSPGHLSIFSPTAVYRCDAFWRARRTVSKAALDNGF
jgi:hypothetical protein